MTARGTAPVAERRPTTRTVHGTELHDDYAWLRADNWQEVLRDPAALPADIRAHLDAENRHAEAYLTPMAELRETLFQEMKARLKPDDASVPQADGPFAYYTRYREGGQHRLVCRIPREGGRETGRETGLEAVLLDGDRLAAGKPFFAFGGVAHTEDHRRLAWGSDDKGSEYHTIRVLDVEAGAMLPDEVPDTDGSAVWARDGQSFFYVRQDENHRPTTVLRHRLGTPAAEDRPVYHEDDAGMFVGLGRTRSGRFAVVSVHDHETSEAHLLDLGDPAAPPRLVAPREAGRRYEVEHHPALDGEERLVILTNADGAEDFKIVAAPLEDPDYPAWRDIEPHAPGRMILSLGVSRGYLVRLEREDGLPRIVVRALEDSQESGHEHRIDFSEEAYSLGLDMGLEFEAPTLRFTYSSMTTPAETYDYDMGTRERTLRKRQEVPSGHDPAAYVTRRLLAPAPDGELVPVSILHRRDAPHDGTAPLLLYGYGAYGISMPAGFSTSILSLVDRGFTYAIAHVRGGTERGWRWYREGKLGAKANTFSDFVAAAEHLVEAGFTARGRIAAHGGSAGGLLMGAVANRSPSLFGAILAEVPFVDALTTMLDSTLPLTPPEWPEWGNPIDEEAAFRTILSYSPVDNVRAQAYPAMLVLAGLTDPRVTYWEPAKWVARLRALRTDDNPLVLRVNMDAGHSGASGRFERLRETALVQAFALHVLGAERPVDPTDPATR